jgi:hypothetical protein
LDWNCWRAPDDGRFPLAEPVAIDEQTFNRICSALRKNIGLKILVLRALLDVAILLDFG